MCEVNKDLIVRLFKLLAPLFAILPSLAAADYGCITKALPTSVVNAIHLSTATGDTQVLDAELQRWGEKGVEAVAEKCGYSVDGADFTVDFAVSLSSTVEEAALELLSEAAKDDSPFREKFEIEVANCFVGLGKGNSLLLAQARVAHLCRDGQHDLSEAGTARANSVRQSLFVCVSKAHFFGGDQNPSEADVQRFGSYIDVLERSYFDGYALKNEPTRSMAKACMAPQG